MKYAYKHNHVNHPFPSGCLGSDLKRYVRVCFRGGTASNFMYFFSMIFMFFKFLNKDKQDSNLKAGLSANK